VVNSEEVAHKEFPIVLAGYSRERVRAFLSELAATLSARDGHIRRLEADLSRARAELAAAENLGRAGLLRHLGAETAAILEAADASAVRMRADAEATAGRIRDGLRTIGGRLADVHQLMGELVAIVQTMSDAPLPPPPPPSVRPVEDDHPAEDHHPARSTGPRFTGDQDVEILLPDDRGMPRFG
jgi:DivIVA domain-containing protein